MVDGPFPSNPYSATPTQDTKQQTAAYYAGQQAQAAAGLPDMFRNPYAQPTLTSPTGPYLPRAPAPLPTGVQRYTQPITQQISQVLTRPAPAPAQAIKTPITGGGGGGGRTGTSTYMPEISGMQNKLQQAMQDFTPQRAIATPQPAPISQPIPSIVQAEKATPAMTQITAPYIPRYTSEIPVLTEAIIPTSMKGLPTATMTTITPIDWSKMMGYPLPGYTGPKGEPIIGYKPLPISPFPTELQGKSTVDKIGYLATHPKTLLNVAGDIGTAFFNPATSETAYSNKYFTGSMTPEVMARTKEANIFGGLIGVARGQIAPFTAAATSLATGEPYFAVLSKQQKEAGMQALGLAVPYSQIKSAELIRDMKAVDYKNKVTATKLENEAKANIIDLLKFQSEHPELGGQVGMLSTQIDSHNLAVKDQEKVIQQYKTDQAAYTKDLNNYEQVLKSVGTYDAATNSYAVPPEAIAQVKLLEVQLDQRATDLNKQYQAITNTNMQLNTETANLEGTSGRYAGPLAELSSIQKRVQTSTTALTGAQEEMKTPFGFVMGSPDISAAQKIRYQVGDIASGIEKVGLETVALQQLGVFRGLSNVAGLIGRELPTGIAAARTASIAGGVALAGLGTATAVSTGSEYAQRYKALGLSPFLGGTVGAIKGLGEFGIATDIASEGQLSLLKGYQVRDIQGNVVGGGLDIQNPLSGKLSSTKPIFSYGEGGVKFFGYAQPSVFTEPAISPFSDIRAFRPYSGDIGELGATKFISGEPSPIPTALLGKQQTAFLTANLPTSEKEAFTKFYGLYTQAAASPQKITGNQYIMDINKAQNLKGLSQEEIDTIKQFGQNYAEQTTGGKAFLNAATNTGPKQFMGSSPGEAKGLLQYNLIRAGKVGDIDVDFYGNALDEGYRVTNALNALGQHKWVFDSELGKVAWLDKGAAKPVFNFLGPDIPGAQLQYTPFGTIQRPSEYIGYQTDQGVIKVATKATPDAFADKIQAGLGDYIKTGGTVKLEVSADKLKNVADLDSYIKALSNKGFIAIPEQGYYEKILTGRNVGLDLTGATTKPVIQMPTPFPISPAALPSLNTASTEIGSWTKLGIVAGENIPSVRTTPSMSLSTMLGPSAVSSISSAISSISRPSSVSVSSVSSVGPSSTSSTSKSSSASSTSSVSSATSASSTSSTSSSSAVPSLIAAAPWGMWPFGGTLGGGPGEAARAGPGQMVGGINVNFLRNFFFEKVAPEVKKQPTAPTSEAFKYDIKIKDMLGTTVAKKSGKLRMGKPQKSLSVRSPKLVKSEETSSLAKTFYSGIASNSTPFPTNLIKRRAGK